MTVSPYLQPVLREAIATLPLLQAWLDAELPIQQRTAANAERQTRMTAVWAAAAAAVPDVVYDQQETDREWAEWYAAGGNRTEGYRLWNSPSAREARVSELAELGVLLSDVRISTPGSVYLGPVTDPDSGAEDLHPAITDLSAMSATRSDPGADASTDAVRLVHARAQNIAEARSAEILEDINSPPSGSLWKLWRKRGGDTDPVFLEWLAAHRASRAFTVPTAPPPLPSAPRSAPAPVSSAGALRRFSTYLGVILPAAPPAEDEVTHLDVRFTSTAGTETVTIPWNGTAAMLQALTRCAASDGDALNGTWSLTWVSGAGRSEPLTVADNTGTVTGYRIGDGTVAPTPVWVPAYTTDDLTDTTRALSSALIVATNNQYEGRMGARATLTEIRDASPWTATQVLYPGLPVAQSLTRVGGGATIFRPPAEALARGNRWRVELEAIDEHGNLYVQGGGPPRPPKFATFAIDGPPHPWSLFN